MVKTEDLIWKKQILTMDEGESQISEYPYVWWTPPLSAYLCRKLGEQTDIVASVDSWYNEFKKYTEKNFLDGKIHLCTQRFFFLFLLSSFQDVKI